MSPKSQTLWALLAATCMAAMAGGSAVAKQDYDDLYFVRPHATAAAMLQDRDECRKTALGLGGTAASYTNPQYGALNAMGSALDEDALHEGGLHKRLRQAIFDDCMKKQGWTPLQPEGEDAKAVERASLRHPEALDTWLKAHEPPPPPPTPAAAPPPSAAPPQSSAQAGSSVPKPPR